MVDYCKHGYSKAQLKARLCVDCDRAKYEATLTTLRAQLAEATRRAEAAERVARAAVRWKYPKTETYAGTTTLGEEVDIWMHHHAPATLDVMGGSICPCCGTVHDSSACSPMRTRLSNSTTMPCLVCGGDGHGAGQCAYFQSPQSESATLTTLRAQLAEATRRAEAAEGERDTLREEVGILRTCVSTHLHGTPQELANAYAALRRLDERRRTATLDPRGGK